MISALPLALMATLGAGAPPAPPAGGTVIVDDRDDATTPAAVVGREALTAPGVTAREVLGRQAGVQAEGLGGPAGMTRVRIRGSTPDQVRLFIDGVALEHADGSPADLSELPLWSAARLDIWRSHAPLGRGGGVGGAVELISRWPDQGLAEVALEAGSFGTWRLGLHGGWADRDERAGMAVGVELLSSDGDFDWTSDNGTLFDPSDDREVTRANNDVKRVTALMRAHVALGRRCRLELLDHVLAVDRGLAGPASSASAAARLGRSSNLAAVAVRCRRRDRWWVRGHVAARWSDTASEDPRGELSPVASAAERRALAPAVALTWGHRLAAPLRLGVHLEGRWQRFRLVDALRPETDATLERFGGALAVELGVAIPVIDVELVPRARVEAFDDVAGAAALEPTWQVALAWRGLSTHGVRLSAAVGSAVRQPNLYELYGDGANVLPSPMLRAEQGLTVAASAGWALGFLPDGWLVDLELSGFFSDVDDLIQLRRNSAQSAVAANEERARLAGAELALRADLFEHLRLAWTHSSLFTESLGRQAARAGKPLPLRPFARNHARVEGYLATGEGSELRWYADLDHVGSNTYDPAALVRAPPRLMVSAGAAWRHAITGLVGRDAALTLGVVVRNLADERAVDLLGYPLQGRAWTLRVGWREAAF